MSDIREAAARYLQHRMRSIHEMRMRLKEKNFHEDEIEGIIDEFISLKYLDDYEYSINYIEYASGKKRGMRRIKAELKERGISDENISRAIEDYSIEHTVSELKDALSVARSVIGDDKIDMDERLTGKIVRKLKQRGYADNDIIKAVAILKKELKSKL